MCKNEKPESTKTEFKMLGNRVIYVTISMLLATSTEPQKLKVIDYDADSLPDASDYALKKLWPHATSKKSSYLDPAMKPALHQELLRRGYMLDSIGSKKARWVKKPVLEIDHTEKP